MVEDVMNQATKSAGLSVVFCSVIWLCTGIWQFAAVAAIGMAFTWVTTPPSRPQPRRLVREFVRVEIREPSKLRRWLTEPSLPGVRIYPGGDPRCYDYGGCQWAGDGCKGKPVVLGPGTGCGHTNPGGIGGGVVRAPEDYDKSW
jgi:hypothetical protein